MGSNVARLSEESFGKLLKRCEQVLLRAKSGALKGIGLTLPQYVALAELDQHPGITSAELARACLVSPQAMMVALKAMQEQGLVERNPHPRHKTVLEIHVTAVGHEALHAGRESRRTDRTANRSGDHLRRGRPSARAAASLHRGRRSAGCVSRRRIFRASSKRDACLADRDRRALSRQSRHRRRASGTVHRYICDADVCGPVAVSVEERPVVDVLTGA